MSDDPVDRVRHLPAPDSPSVPPPPPAPTLPSLPTLPSTTPRAPVAPPAPPWVDDQEATGHGALSGVPAATPLTTAGSTVHRYSAKELVEASRIKATDKPAYGDLPKANAESAAHADDLRRKAAQIRNRNKRLGWYMAIAGIVAVLGIFAVAFVLFQQEEDGNDEPPVPTAVVPSAPLVEGGAGTPLGEQVAVVEGLDVINQSPVAGGGIANDLINDANNVVAGLNGGTTVP